MHARNTLLETCIPGQLELSQRGGVQLFLAESLRCSRLGAIDEALRILAKDTQRVARRVFEHLAPTRIRRLAMYACKFHGCLVRKTSMPACVA